MKSRAITQEMVFAMRVANEGLESRMNETLPQINKKWKNNSAVCSGSRETLGRRGDAGCARQRKDASSPSHRGRQSHTRVQQHRTPSGCWRGCATGSLLAGGGQAGKQLKPLAKLKAVHSPASTRMLSFSRGLGGTPGKSEQECSGSETTSPPHEPSTGKCILNVSITFKHQKGMPRLK